MSLKNQIMTSIRNYSADIEQLEVTLAEADCVLIGAGAGLSTSAGFVYDGDRFTKSFSDFEQKYNFHDMYSGGCYPFSSLEEQWAFWSRNIYINRYMDAPKPVYKKLLELVQNKDYFVLTTNVDHQFQRAGFDKNKLFYMQGDYGLFQCSQPCHKETYDNEQIVISMLEQQKNMRIPTELIPCCPRCGRPMIMNLRSDNRFVENAGWFAARTRYNMFLSEHQNSKIMFWELGVGYNTPSIIKYSFWSMTMQNPQAHYVCINYGDSDMPREIAKQSVCINDDIGNVLNKLQDNNAEENIV